MKWKSSSPPAFLPDAEFSGRFRTIKNRLDRFGGVLNQKS